MLKKVRKFCKRQKDKLVPESYEYEPFVNEERTMEFGMESTTGQVDERIAFGPMAKGQKRYGSTSRRPASEDAQGLPYIVKGGDTLQGLAVKFGVTTEQIRRTNQLWTNDSLFLRDKLIIPVPIPQLDNGNKLNGQSSTSSIVSSGSSVPECKSSATTNGSTSLNQNYPSHPAPNGISSLSEELSLSFQSPEPMSTGSKHWTHPLSDSFEYDDGLTTPDSIKLDTDTPPSPNFGTTDRPNGSHQNGATSYAGSGAGDSARHAVSDHSEKTASEFLSRIDVAIASTKQKTLPMSQTSQPWVTFESDSESEQQLNRSGTSLLAHGRHLRHSLRKLEKKQEELFQL